MSFTRPLACIDIESTGVDPVTDRIVELAVTVLNPDGERTRWEFRFNPGVPISSEATAVHGITNEMVADCPTFADKSRSIWAALQGKDLAGYNILRFDVNMLDEELRRCGYALDPSQFSIVDVFGIYSKKESRKLEDAVLRYCDREHTGAHGAAADCEATTDVLLSQLGEYADLSAMSVSELAAFSRMSELDPVDLAGKLYRDKEGFACYAFGKHKDVRVVDQPGYARWMASASFPSSTLDALELELNKKKGARLPIS